MTDYRTESESRNAGRRWCVIRVRCPETIAYAVLDTRTGFTMRFQDEDDARETADRANRADAKTNPN